MEQPLQTSDTFSRLKEKVFGITIDSSDFNNTNIALSRTLAGALFQLTTSSASKPQNNVPYISDTIEQTQEYQQLKSVHSTVNEGRSDVNSFFIACIKGLILPEFKIKSISTQIPPNLNPIYILYNLSPYVDKIFVPEIPKLEDYGTLIFVDSLSSLNDIEKLDFSISKQGVVFIASGSYKSVVLAELAREAHTITNNVYFYSINTNTIIRIYKPIVNPAKKTELSLGIKHIGNKAKS